MIRVNSRRHYSAAVLLRRLSIGNEPSRPRTALDNRCVVRSPQGDAASAYRDRATELATPSTASQTSGQRTSASDRLRRNPHSA